MTVQRRGRARGPLADVGQRPARAGRQADRRSRSARTRSRGRARCSTTRRCPTVEPPRRRGAPIGAASSRATNPPRVHRAADDAAPLRRRRRSAAPSTARSAAGSACARSARSTRSAVALLADAWFPAPWPRLRRARPGADDRPHGPLPRAAAAARLAAARPLHQPARARRLLRGGRRALGARTERWSPSRASSGC